MALEDVFAGVAGCFAFLVCVGHLAPVLPARAVFRFRRRGGCAMAECGAGALPPLARAGQFTPEVFGKPKTGRRHAG